MSSSICSKSLAYRNVILGFTAFYMAFYSGSFWGYSPLQLLFERDSAFIDKCSDIERALSSTPSYENNNSSSYAQCQEQSDSLVRAQFVASILCQILTPLFGDLADSYGPFWATLFLALSGSLGLVMICIASITHIYNLLYLALLLLGSMAMTSVPVIMTTAYTLFNTERSQSRVITLLNAVYDCGSGFDYWLLYQYAQNSGSTLVDVIRIYLIVAILVFTPTLFLWYKVSSNNTSCLQEMTENTTNGKKTQLLPDPNTSQLSTIQKTTYWEEMNTSSFWILTFIYSIHVSRIGFVLTTSRDFLRYLGDDATGNKYVSILSWTSPLALLGLPMVDYILETHGYIAGLQCINIIAILHGLILCFSTTLQVQVVGFVLLALYHCFLFGIIFSFLGTIVGQHVIGKLSGILSAVGGICQLSNIPMGRWAIVHLGGNFFWPNFLYLVSVVPCIFGVFMISKEKKVFVDAELV